MRSTKPNFLDPTTVLSAAVAEMEPISSEELFNDPQHKPLLDRWCAGSFGIGYQKHVASCKVVMQAPGTREDFYLLANGCEFPFQTIMALEEGRHIGDEYRGPPSLTPYTPASLAQALRWLEAAVQK